MGIVKKCEKYLPLVFVPRSLSSSLPRHHSCCFNIRPVSVIRPVISQNQPSIDTIPLLST